MKKSEQELADELDAFLKATMRGRPTPANDDLPQETLDLAASLIKLSQEAKPDPAHRTTLEKQLAVQAGRFPAAAPLSFQDQLTDFFRSITMRRPILVMGGFVALFVAAFVAWRIFSGGATEGPGTEQVAGGTPAATIASGDVITTPAVGALPTLPAISMAGGMGGGNLGMGGGGPEVASDNSAMPIEKMLPMTSIFSGTTFALNTTLQLEPTSANVLEYPSPTVDMIQAQQLAGRFGFTGPLYLQSYPVYATDPAVESGDAAPIPEIPPTYFAFDGTRQFTVYQGGASYYDSSVVPDYNNPISFEQALPFAESFLRDRGLLDFPYVTQKSYGSMVLFYRQIDGRTLNYPEITVEVANDGRIFNVGYQVMANLQTVGAYPLQTAETAWQMLQTGMVDNQFPYYTYASEDSIASQPPVAVDNSTYQYWQRTRQPGEEAHFYSTPIVYLPADGNGVPSVYVNNYQLQGSDADLQAIAGQVNGNVHVWGQIGTDGRSLTLAGWEALVEIPYTQVNGTVERTADQVLIQAVGQTYILPNAPADLPNGLAVDVFALATRDAGLAYPILEWDGLSKFVPVEPVVEGTVAPAEGGGGPIDGLPFEPFTYQQVTVNQVELAYFYMPVWQEQQANSYAPPRVLLQPVWEFTAQANNGDRIEFFVPAVAPEYLATPNG